MSQLRCRQDDPLKFDPATMIWNGIAVSRMHDGYEAPVLLRILRRGTSTTQADAARCAGISQSRLSRIENGKADPTWREIKGLLKAIGCRPLLFAHGAGWTPRPPRGYVPFHLLDGT